MSSGWLSLWGVNSFLMLIIRCGNSNYRCKIRCGWQYNGTITHKGSCHTSFTHWFLTWQSLPQFRTVIVHDCHHITFYKSVEYQSSEVQSVQEVDLIIHIDVWPIRIPFVNKWSIFGKFPILTLFRCDLREWFGKWCNVHILPEMQCLKL